MDCTKRWGKAGDFFKFARLKRAQKQRRKTLLLLQPRSILIQLRDTRKDNSSTKLYGKRGKTCLNVLLIEGLNFKNIPIDTAHNQTRRL